MGGKFLGPTWSQDGQTLAWQEGNGIWSARIPDITNCTTVGQSRLIVAGGSEPDFGPAAVNPGPRPPCGNPGNPAGTPACTTPPPNPPCCTPPNLPGVNVRQLLSAFLSSATGALKRLAIHGLLHKGQIGFTFNAPGAGTLTALLMSNGRHPMIVAGGRLVFTAGGKRTVVLKVTRKGRGLLRHARRFHGTLKLTFAPGRGAATVMTTGLLLKR